MSNSKWYTFNFLSFKEKVVVITGLLMIVANSITDMLTNGVSIYVYSLGQGLFLICCFVFIFFRFTQNHGFQFKVSNTSDQNIDVPQNIEQPKEDIPNEIKPEESLQIKGELINKLFPLIRLLAYVFLITNILSCGYYFYDTLYYQKQHVTVSQMDVETITNLIASPGNTQKQIIDSVNERFPKQVFFSPGKVISMRLDTSGSFFYYYRIDNNKKQFLMNITSLKIRFTNFTKCKEEQFCTCDSANICLKDKRIELYYLLFLHKEKKVTITDTLYFSRIQNAR